MKSQLCYDFSFDFIINREKNKTHNSTLSLLFDFYNIAIDFLAHNKYFFNKLQICHKKRLLRQTKSLGDGDLYHGKYLRRTQPHK